MTWSLEEAIAHYQRQGAPGDQNAVIGLLREVQLENHGSIPQDSLSQIAKSYGVRESFLMAVIRRIPSLRLADRHCLELCGGPRCAKGAALASFVEETYGANPQTFTLKYTPCMRQCGSGPNLKWDGKLYHRADVELIRRLVQQA